VSDPRVVGVRIYRDNPGEKDKKIYRIATIGDTLHTHYIDSGLLPETTYRYRFTTLDAQGRESMPNRTIAAKTLGLPEPVSYFTATKELARSAKLLWRPHPDLRIVGYEIERLDPGEKSFHRIGSVDGRLNAEYIDRDLDDSSIYRYRIVAVSFDGKKSAPSEEVSVSTKPLPLPPKQLNAGNNGIRTIALSWEASPNKDIAYYKVYRADSPDGYFSYRAKVDRTSFTDKTDEDGARYFYKVTAVDQDGLESPSGEAVAGTTKAAPEAPELLGLAVSDNAVVIRWKSRDPRTRSYELHKSTSSGWFDTNETVIRDIRMTTYTDANIAPGTEYEYAVVAVDKDGLKSAPSESKSVMIEEQ